MSAMDRGIKAHMGQRFHFNFLFGCDHRAYWRGDGGNTKQTAESFEWGISVSCGYNYAA